MNQRGGAVVARVESEATATRSGYPRTVKLWKRGTAWETAKIVAEGIESDISVGPFAVMDGDTRYVGIDRGVGFYADKRSILMPDGRLVELPIPETAEFQAILQGQAIVRLIDPLGELQIQSFCRDIGRQQKTWTGVLGSSAWGKPGEDILALHQAWPDARSVAGAPGRSLRCEAAPQVIHSLPKAGEDQGHLAIAQHIGESPGFRIRFGP